jgi:catechol 2,3-dioxygenase-like lactoylglutathione lyase family enzyme
VHDRRRDFARPVARPALVVATTPFPEQTMLARSRLAATFPVRDLKAAKRFYSDQLRLPLAAGSPKAGFLEYRAGGGTRLLVFRSRSGGKTGNTGATFSVANLDREMAALRARGVEFEEYDLPGCKTVDGVARMGGHRMAWVADPDGNLLALHEGA